MKSITFLYLAYSATWLIHAGYLASIVRRYRRLAQQKKELGKGRG